MKYYLLSFLAATMAVCAQAQGTARLKGHISGATTECFVELMQATDNDYKIDTLKADANGNFDFVVEIIPNATECELLLSASHAKKNIFLSPDMVAELDIYIFPTGDRADPFDFKIDYSGDNADAYTYLNTYASLMDFYKRIANEMANWTFVEYREAVMKDMDNARHMLANIKNTEFRQKQYRLLYESLDQKLEIYPSKNADRHDPDAIKWIEGIEHNDTSNMMPAYDYFYWYLKEHNIKNDDLFKELPKIFYDQDMINKFADNQIVQMLRNAPENMDQLLADYLKVSTNEKGHVKAMRVQRMELGEPDASGRRKPVPVEGAIEEIPVDIVIVAVGVSPNQLVPRSIEGLDVSRRNTIVVNEETMQSNIGDLYAGGDIVRGGATVILAMGDGRRAAQNMARQLLGE